MITLLNLPILLSLLQDQCIYIYIVCSIWHNFSCLQVTHPPRGHKQLSQADGTTVSKLKSRVAQTKALLICLLISLCLYLYLKHSSCKKTSLTRAWSCPESLQSTFLEFPTGKPDVLGFITRFSFIFHNNPLKCVLFFICSVSFIFKLEINLYK